MEQKIVDVWEILKHTNPEEIGLDIPDEVYDEWAKQAEIDQRREKRLADCGKFAYWFNVHTGNKEGYTFRCSLFRECDICLNIRAEQERQFVKDAVNRGKKMVAVRGDTTEIASIIKSIKILGGCKSNYVRYPISTNDGEIFEEILVIEERYYTTGEEVNWDWIANQNWIQIANTPEGRNRSGTVHLPPPTKEKEPFSFVETRSVITSAPAGEVNRMMDQIVSQTKDFDPQGAEEVQECLDNRTRRLVAALQQKDYEVRTYYKNVKVYHNKIDWNQRKLLADYSDIDTENLRSGGQLKVPIWNN